MFGALDFIATWASAIAQFEGGTPGSVASRNNNPGNLKYAGQAGAVGKDAAGFAIFPDPATGMQALYNQLTKYVSDYPNNSLLDITAHYLGQPTPTVNSQGNAFTYAAFVASQLGVDPSTTLGELVSGSQPPGVPIPAGLAPDPSSSSSDQVLAAAALPVSSSDGSMTGILLAAAALGLLFLVMEL
jgi:hypothetical protein